MAERCHCGRLLHYTDPVVEQSIRWLVERYGPTVVVTTIEGDWRVPRHYIALHGLKASELPGLGFERVTVPRGPGAIIVYRKDDP